MQVLRCHTSAHQAELLRKGEKSFLVTGDVYRRDSIDASHYPVFHQMEALYVLSDQEIEASGKSGTQLASEDLKFVLSGLTKHLFGDVEMKFVDAYFPFTVGCTARCDRRRDTLTASSLLHCAVSAAMRAQGIFVAHKLVCCIPALLFTLSTTASYDLPDEPQRHQSGTWSFRTRMRASQVLISPCTRFAILILAVLADALRSLHMSWRSSSKGSGWRCWVVA